MGASEGMTTMSSPLDHSVIMAELAFLRDNPEFAQRPATIVEFLGPDYLNISDRVRPGLREALVGIFGTEVSSSVISRVRRALVTGGIGIGKGHTYGTPVLTPSGWVPVEELLEGDRVIGSNGRSASVTGVYPRGKLQSYRVTFNDDSWVVVDGDHLWDVKTPNEKMRGRDWKTISTRELIRLGVTNPRGQKNYHIPVVAPVNFDHQEDLPISPYLLGALIGDGGLTQSSPIISSADAEILSRVQAESGLHLNHKGQYDYTLAAGGRGGSLEDRGNWLTDELKACGLWGHYSYNKFIPRQYLTASIEDRIDLLRGLMDTDGYILPHGSVQISTSSGQLATDMVELVRSLGGIARRTRKATAGRDAHILTLNVPFNPFYLKRKASQWAPFEKYLPSRMIASIEPEGVEEIVCISVDAPDQLYVTKDFIVTHNTTFASIAIPFMVHWVSCLKNPQEFYNLMDGSRIAFMLMSTSDTQAKEVLFGDIKARIQHSPWFKANCMFDDSFKNQLRFPKDIWVLPGNSAETTFEGYNILGGILDEGDSHKQTKEKDYAEIGYDTIHARIDSRFNDPKTGKHGGLLIAIGQMKRSSGFMAKKKKELEKDEDALVVTMSIWESMGWDKYLNPDGTRNSFYYDTLRKQIVPKLLAENLGTVSKNLIEVPMSYRASFENNPEKAMRDLAGIPPASDQPFISLVDRVEECTERWVASHTSPLGQVEVPVTSDPTRPMLDDSVRAFDSLRRALHIDIAISGEGDALGLAMGHVPYLVDIEGELKPHIVFDFLMRIKAAPGTEIILGDIRKVIYELKDDRGFRIKVATLDGFQSTDTRQQLNKRRIATDYLSVDKSLTPYYDLREAIYERRVDFPPYVTYLSKGSTEKVEIAKKELLELSETGNKVDHPASGSKDVADAMAGVVFTLMGDRAYRRVAHGAPDGYGEPDKQGESHAGTATQAPGSVASSFGRDILSPGLPGVPSLSEWLETARLPR